jgi:hypothetical protein
MGELATKVTDSLKALMELQIITVVGKVTVSNAFNPDNRTIEIAEDQQAMVTSINLVQGDITNGLDESFAPGNEDALREFHERQVKLGNEIINRNLRLLKEMATEIIDIVKEEKSADMA